MIGKRLYVLYYVDRVLMVLTIDNGEIGLYNCIEPLRSTYKCGNYIDKKCSTIRQQ